MRKLTALYTLLMLALLYIGLVIVNNEVFDSVRLDLTESKIFTLSSGSQQVIDGMDEPVTLYFFFSQEATKGMTALRNYAERVESLLREYEKASGGSIRLKVIDPEPFSEAEDKATQFGLTGATLGNNDEVVYFGLAATNMLDDQLTIGFFDPQKEQFLEYDISKVLHQLSDARQPVVALISDLPVAGGQNPMTARFDPPMVFYEQLTQLFDVRRVPSDADRLPEGTDVVMLAHPKQMSEALKYAIDQFAMKQGRVVAFVDPHYESDMLAMMGSQQPNGSDTSLLRDWGIDIAADTILLDGAMGLDIRGPKGEVIKHPGILGLSTQQLSRSDVITANLDTINLASTGTLALLPSSTLDITPLIQSSAQGYLYDAQDYIAQAGTTALKRGLTGTPLQYTIAGHITGTTISAFGQAIAGADPATFKATTDNLNVLVVADADMLADRFWVQQSQFFGETLHTPFANNGDFITNIVENLSGSNALISIRSRGQSARPFTRVATLQNKAQKRFREHELQLQDELASTEEQLAQLKNHQGQGGTIVITDEQQRTIDRYVEKRLKIRRELRDVRYELDRDIDQLGNWLKFVNIAAAPLVLVLMLYLLALALRLRPGKAYTKE
ncbi:Gldg family protein [Salinimonas sediminis]|uniref:ABC transporter n=1 Tax=Salinimonas sediminis TaxID=2303538 RepID=A0A346NNY7_9ALTE|nr:Gldg family protein [Salinimonas sediminis]AXR07244.1 ABC transporter [Salinimonas sediminis]